MNTTTAQFKTKCCDCGTVIPEGEIIGIVSRNEVCCEECRNDRDDCDRAYREGDQAGLLEEADAPGWPPSPSVLASDRCLASRGLTVVRFAGGAVMTQNSNGRCIDAPCCGCCS